MALVHGRGMVYRTPLYVLAFAYAGRWELRSSKIVLVCAGRWVLRSHKTMQSALVVAGYTPASCV